MNEILNALRPDSDVVTVTVEAPDAGNVDDVVVRRQSGRHRYTHVKHAVDATTPVGTDWLTESPRLHGVGKAVRDAGQHRVVVRGFMRLPVWFDAGAAFRHVRGFEVAAQQGAQHWSSEDLAGNGPGLDVTVENIDQGRDLAVAIGVATDPTPGVRRSSPGRDCRSLGQLRCCRRRGPVPQRSRTAAGLAVAAVKEVRGLLETGEADRIHLFLAAPGAFTLLVGHRWNALRPTTVYEHLRAGRGYVATIRIDS